MGRAPPPRPRRPTGPPATTAEEIRQLGSTALTRWSSAAGYGLATLALLLVGLAVAAALGAGRPWVVVGAGSAWLVQALSFLALARALAAGRDAVRPWLTGIAARFGGLAVAAVVTASTAVGAELPVAYAAALLGFLLAEAAWLARRPW